MLLKIPKVTLLKILEKSLFLEHNSHKKFFVDYDFDSDFGGVRGGVFIVKLSLKIN